MSHSLVENLSVQGQYSIMLHFPGLKLEFFKNFVTERLLVSYSIASAGLFSEKFLFKKMQRALNTFVARDDAGFPYYRCKDTDKNDRKLKTLASQNVRLFIQFLKLS